MPKNITSTDIPARYNPEEEEKRWYRWWQKNKLFHADPHSGGKPYTIVIPPPNITGILHMGHALNNTIQDILIRWRRMQGYNALWVPGTDHAGIATQNVVERKLKKEGKLRKELGREKFIEKVWEWREQYGSTIINQLKRMGCSCDWERTRFTMDSGLSRAVQEVFIRLYNKGLIYRGNYIINWCPRCQTAISDEETEHKDVNGSFYYIKYPIKEGGYITVATTRPETMLGDTAVAVNPKDKRYDFLIGKTVILPILSRPLKVITDDYVDPEFGTGIVKITPAHDPNDFLIGKRHDLPVINVMNEDGTMNDNAGPYNGQDRFECRKSLLADLSKMGLLEKTIAHTIAAGHCYRCHTVVEPRISKQWFVKMKPLAEPAIDAVKNGKIKFYPQRWTKVYLEWMYNIRDWCISRQIWWGHRIPVWYCEKCRNAEVTAERPEKCSKCGSTEFTQEQDVLDTWFSSWLWPFSALGWPNDTSVLRFYYPTDTLITAQEIIFFWVARMIMAGIEFTGKAPFRQVYIHGTVRDETGTKMSKSLGNVIDPLEIIREFGADALRFTIVAITAQGQDVFLNRHSFEAGRNFNNKIWNASRFLLMNLKGDNDITEPFFLNEWQSDDWFIIGKLQITIKAVTNSLETFHFKDAAQTLYDFFWHDFCDKYIEIVKPDIQSNKECQKILFYVLETALRLLHPFIPFITEDIWQKLKEISHLGSSSIMTSPWPRFNKDYYKEGIVAEVENKFILIREGRSLRSEYNVGPSVKAVFFVKPNTEKYQKFLLGDKASLIKLLGAGDITIDMEFKPDSPMPVSVTPNGSIYMPITGLDSGRENARIEKELSDIEKQLGVTGKKLQNKQFLDKAPAEVIEKTRLKKKVLADKRKKLKQHIKYLNS